MRDAAEAGAAPSPARSQVLEYDDPAYPKGLRDLADAPARLFVLGSVPAGPGVAVVGSRAATPYGLLFARRLACDLARLGVPVVSGLARGIDAAAHLGALEGGGRTVAVLPSGLDSITPAHHADLAARIAARGALITEIESGGPRFRGQFVERNRLIAAFAAATVVVEAAEGSGALTTAAAAARLGRPLLAVPGDVSRPTARGCHQLLRSGAALCEHAGDVLAALASAAAAADPAQADARGAGGAPPEAAAGSAGAGAARAAHRATPRPAIAPGGAPAPSRGGRRHAAATPAACFEPPGTGPQARLLAALSLSPATVDTLAARSGLAVDAALAALLELEWAGLARPGPGPRWTRAPR